MIYPCAQMKTLLQLIIMNSFPTCYFVNKESERLFIFSQDTWVHSALNRRVKGVDMDDVTTALMANHAPAILVGRTDAKSLALIPNTGPARKSGTVWSRVCMVTVQTTLTSANVPHLTRVRIAIR